MTAARQAVTVNGTARALTGTDPATTALDFLRGAGLTGAKEGCAEGECGACAVMVVRPAPARTGMPVPARSRWTAVNACLVPAAALDGQEVVTAEGLGSPDALHPVQHELAVRGGSQCGYCTPGFVCAMAAEYYRDDRAPDAPALPTPSTAPTGSTCTPWAATSAAAPGTARSATPRTPWGARRPMTTSRRGAAAPAPPATRLEGRSGVFERATDLAHALRLLADHPDAVLVAGSTDWGVEVNLRGARAPFVVGIDRVPELRDARRGRRRRRDRCGPEPQRGRARPRWSDPVAGQHVPAVRLPADPQRRDPRRQPRHGLPDRRRGTGAPGPGGRGRPRLGRRRAGGAAVRLLHRLPADREAPGELIRAVRIPLPLSGTTAFHKIAKRRFDDISSVAAGIALDVRDGVVARARIGLGGVAATPVRALATEAALEGRPWDAATVRAAAEVMATEGTPIDDHRASAAYRSAMLGTALADAHDARPRAGGGGVSQPGDRPASALVGPGPPRVRGPPRHRGGALHRRPRRADPRRAHAHPVQAPHAHARVTALRPDPRSSCPASCGSSPPTTCPASTTPG